MSFPVDRARALDGELVAGDVVDVIAVDAHTATARYVATDVEVLRVDGEQWARSARAASDSITVTLAVDPDVALGIATAVHGNDLSLVRATGCDDAPMRPARDRRP